MTKYEEEILAKLTNIAYKERDYLAEYDKITRECANKLMSKGDGLYGMFWPDPEMQKYITYKGKLTKNEKKRDFVYYFDEQNRLRLTERYNGDKVRLLDYVFYFYYDQHVEIVWYGINSKMVDAVGFVDYENGKMVRFVEDLYDDFFIHKKQPLVGFDEYDFSKDEEYVIKTVYHTGLSFFFEKGKEYRSESKMRKYW